MEGLYNMGIIKKILSLVLDPISSLLLRRVPYSVEKLSDKTSVFPFLITVLITGLLFYLL